MALSLVNSLAPPLRYDHAQRSDKPIMDARNIGVSFKVERLHGLIGKVEPVDPFEKKPE